MTDYPIGKAEYRRVEQLAEVWRGRLTSVSWFMRCLNEHIARMANEEDGCSGRFWEGRYKCQALLDESALLACMAYVDLNPVRAGMSQTPEESEHTSVQRRIGVLKDTSEGDQPTDLMPFIGNEENDMPKGLAYHFTDYLELIDWTGRAIRDDKRGSIPDALPPIVQRLGIDDASWLEITTGFEDLFQTLVGTETAIQTANHHLGKHWSQGIGSCRRYFPT